MPTRSGTLLMPHIDFTQLALSLPAAWTSTVAAKVGPARIKVLRMDACPYEEETHNYNEALIVIEGELQLDVDGAHHTVSRGEMYLVDAGVPHRVHRGSHGILVIVDI